MKSLYIAVVLAVCVALVRGSPGDRAGGKKPGKDSRGDHPDRPGPPEGRKDPTVAPKQKGRMGKRPPFGGDENGDVKIGEGNNGIKFGVNGVFEIMANDSRIPKADGTGGRQSVNFTGPVVEDIPFSDDGTGSPVKGDCFTTTITLYTGATVEFTCCNAITNGTITLDPSGVPEVDDIFEGDVKCTTVITGYTFCGSKDGESGEDCDGYVGAKLCAMAKIKGPKGKKLKSKGRKAPPPGAANNAKGPKTFELGENGKGPKMRVATTVQITTDAGVKSWETLGADDTTVEEDDDEEDDDEDEESMRADFCFPRILGAPLTYTYDPTFEEGSDDEDGGTGAATAVLASLAFSLLPVLLAVVLN